MAIQRSWNWARHRLEYHTITHPTQTEDEIEALFAEGPIGQCAKCEVWKHGGEFPERSNRGTCIACQPATKQCSKCGETKGLGEFYRHSNTSAKLRNDCRACHLRQTLEYDRTCSVSQKRQRRLKHKYGLDNRGWESLFNNQGSRCAVCRASVPGHVHGWHTDHNHVTGEVRGILCHHCNVMLGGSKDSGATLQLGAEYLASYRGKNRRRCALTTEVTEHKLV